jgi:hypothetical protein
MPASSMVPVLLLPSSSQQERLINHITHCTLCCCGTCPAPRRAQQQADAHRSNQQQLARKAEEADAVRAADRAFRKAWGERLQELREEERREAAEARSAAQQVQRFQQWQAARRTAGAAVARAANVQDALMATAAVAEADADFGAYAAALRTEAVRRGLPLEPIDRYVAAAAHESPVLVPP